MMRRRAALAALAASAAGVAFAPVAAQTPAKLPAVVVWDFDDQSAGGTLQAGQADFLRRSLSENLTAALLQVPGLPVVERQRLKDVLAEQKVGSDTLADADARLRLGRIVGAARMVFGGFFVLGDAVQVHVRVVDTASSRVLFSDEAAAPLAALMRDVDELNRRVAQALGGGAAAASRVAAFPTALWQDYDKALALADAGQYDAAVAALQALLAREKDFAPAERQLVSLLDRMSRK